ncbi:nucleoside transporter C-terminal domain-containing protein [Rariglobus hedericola]
MEPAKGTATISMDSLIHIGRGLLGIFVFTGIAVAFSTNRRAINWRLVGSALLLQLIFAALVIHVAPVRWVIEMAGGFFVRILGFSAEGTAFLFGSLASKEKHGFVIALVVLPSVVFFSALTSLLYYLGVLQKIVMGFAWIMSKTMNLSGAESLSTAANIFLGQTEAPLIIKPYLGTMTRSELLAVMVGGMATIAGGVMIAYISFLGGDDPQQQIRFATHLITASVISAPAALMVSKILLPQTETVSRDLHVPRERLGANFIDAICVGTTDGLKLALNLAGMLIVFTALVAMANYILSGWIGAPFGLNEWIAQATGGVYRSFSLEFILGMICAPVAWLIGIDSGHLMVSGQLLGTRTVLNEFISYLQLGQMKAAGTFTDERATIILTYALCGFANLVSIGIQVGGIGALAPDKRSDLARLGGRALLGGSLACFLTACVAGILI